MARGAGVTGQYRNWLDGAFGRRRVVAEAKLVLEPIPREALFLAGKVFLDHRRRKGSKQAVRPDFYIGAHAAVSKCSILTRDVGCYRSYFPTVPLITPESEAGL